MTSPSNENVAPFRPFETYIEQSKALTALKDLTNGADDGELYFERSSNETLVFDNNKLKICVNSILMFYFVQYNHILYKNTLTLTIFSCYKEPKGIYTME